MKTRTKATTPKASKPKITGYEIESNRESAPTPPEGIYYNPSVIMSKNRLFNFIVGIRGGGKTYGFLKFITNAYLKHGRKTIWLRRQATEIDDMFIRDFFKSIARNGEFPLYDFKVQKTAVDGICYGYIRLHAPHEEWEQFMMFLPLSISLSHKGNELEDYNYVIFDEFLIDPKFTNLHYLSGWNEPTIFLEFFESVVRTRNNVRAIFISNAVASVNPYFTAFNVQFDKNKEWLLTDFICVHNYKNEKFKTYKKHYSTWGKFLSTTQYGQYNMDNAFVNETEDFISDLPPKSYLLFNIRFMKDIYGVYANENTGKIYISPKTDKTAFTCCFTTDDMKPNLLMIDETRGANNRIAGTIRKAYKNGYLYYDSQETKLKIQDLINMLV